jgi:hypothetical protein
MPRDLRGPAPLAACAGRTVPTLPGVVPRPSRGTSAARPLSLPLRAGLSPPYRVSSRGPAEGPPRPGPSRCLCGQDCPHPTGCRPEAHAEGPPRPGPSRCLCGQDCPHPTGCRPEAHAEGPPLPGPSRCLCGQDCPRTTRCRPETHAEGPPLPGPSRSLCGQDCPHPTGCRPEAQPRDLRGPAPLAACAGRTVPTLPGVVPRPSRGTSAARPLSLPVRAGLPPPYRVSSRGPAEGPPRPGPSRCLCGQERFLPANMLK